MNICEYRHKDHKTLEVDTILGSMTVYNWNKYYTTEGYCSGRDDISRTLFNEGVWEKLETVVVMDILKKGNRSDLVVDIGAHIGWFSRMANQLGYRVEAYEADKQNIELLILNTDDSLINIHYQWVDEESEPLEISQEILLVKIDIEGLEQAAVNMLCKQFENQQVKYALIEISPIFNDSYPGLVNQLENYGYKTLRNGKVFDGDYDFKQDNFLFVRGDLYESE